MLIEIEIEEIEIINKNRDNKNEIVILEIITSEIYKIIDPSLIIYSLL